MSSTHPVHSLEVDVLGITLVQVKELAVAFLITELNHVVGVLRRILPNPFELLKLHRHGDRHLARVPEGHKAI